MYVSDKASKPRTVAY